MRSPWRALAATVLFLVGCEAATPAAVVSPGPSPGPGLTTAEQVAVAGGLTEVVSVGGDLVLFLDVTNNGVSDIDQLTIVVNDAFMAAMSVQDTSPPALRHNEQGGEYFLFGSLPRGKTTRYLIRLLPRQTGTFTAIVDVASWSSVDMQPLPTEDGGVAELTFETEVVPR